MSIFKALFYGAVQGLTEFLPVSSSGHLAILQNIFGLDNIEHMLLYNLLLHIGSLLAVFIMFRRDILLLLVSVVSIIKKLLARKFNRAEASEGERFVLLALIASIPLAGAALISNKIEYISGYTKIVGAFLIFNALILFLSDKIKSGKKTAKNASFMDALCVGLCQFVAILPGISRSGSTITGGLFMGFRREFAFKFSFILSIPAILGSSAFELLDIIGDSSGGGGVDIVPYLAGMAAAFVTGIVAIWVLRVLIKKKNFYIFSAYCLLAGLVAVIFG